MPGAPPDRAKPSEPQKTPARRHGAAPGRTIATAKPAAESRPERDGDAAAEAAQATVPVAAKLEQAAAPPPAAEQPKSLWGRILDVFGGGDDPERTKRRLLKNIAREMARDRGAYYVARADAAGVGLARLFHAFHCTLGPAQTLLENASASEALRAMVIESCLTPEELALRDRLTDEGVSSIAEGVDAHRFGERVRHEIDRFAALFTHERIAAINSRMRDFWVLLDLISFDYHLVLKKFDPAIPRTDYAYPPSFSPTNAEYVAGDLRDFLEILLGVDPAGDWDALFDTLKQYRRMEAVSREAWRKLLHGVDRLTRTNRLTSLLRLLEKNPHAKISPRNYARRSAEEYLDKVRMQAELALQRALSRKRTARIDEMVRKTFGKTPEQRLVHYLPSANPGFEKRGAPGYVYATPLNYLKAYLADYLEQELKSVVDLVIVKGRWATTLSSHTLSESLQATLNVAEQLAEFDGSLAEDGPRGQKVKAAVMKASRNKKEAYALRQTLRLVNETARGIMTATLQAMVGLGRMLKTLLDDVGIQDPRMVLNWRDLDTMAEHQLKNRFVTAYTRLYNLVQLLGQYRDVRSG